MTDHDSAARIARMLADSGLIEYVSAPVLASVKGLIAEGVLNAQPTKQRQRG